MNPIFIAMALGLAGTSVIHLSKGFMAYGISSEPGTHKKTVYLLGMLFNFTNPLWVIAANRFAPTPYYTSMYGFGLLPLFLYSRFFLSHHFTKSELASTLFIVAGTSVLGYGQIRSTLPSMYTPNPEGILVFAGIWFLLSPLLLFLAGKYRIKIQEALFGLAAGGMAALDAVLKGIAQARPTGSGFLPVTTAGWIIFLSSFLGAAGAFILIQWSYLRHCRPSMMGGIYDVSYTAMPLIILGIFRGFDLTSFSFLGGLALLTLGILLQISENQLSLPWSRKGA